MEKEKRIALPFDWPRVHEPAKLTIPEKEADTRNTMLTKHQFLRVTVKLPVQSIQFRNNEQARQHRRQQPTDVEQLLPLPGKSQMPCNSPTNRHQGKGTFGHHCAGSKEGA